MRYRETIEKSAELVRQALPLMARQPTALHPISFAVWYEYVAGTNAPLKASIDAALQEGGQFDEAATAALYRRFIAEIDEATAQRVASGFQRVLGDISQSATTAGQQADAFGASLRHLGEGLSAEASAQDLAAVVSKTLDDTRQMQQSVSTLKARLDASRREIEDLRAEVCRARQEALADGLTGLANRRRFDAALAELMAEDCADSNGLSLVIADIDRFKTINDTYGHLFGDRVICMVAEVLKRNVKGKDVAARFGGEEFVVLLPDTPVEGARVLAETIRTGVANCRIRRVDNDETIGNITISLGVTGYRPGEAVQAFLCRADEALYIAKNQGRNRVSVAATA
jgi:diguanylate cyclase